MIACQKSITIVKLRKSEEIIIMMDQIVKVAWELNDNSENRYQLVYEIAELAKKLVDETQMKKAREDFGYEEFVAADKSFKKENEWQGIKNNKSITEAYHKAYGIKEE